MKAWVIGGLVLVAFGALSLNVPGRTVRWLERVATWDAQVAVDSARQAQQAVWRDSVAGVLADRAKEIAAREQRLAVREQDWRRRVAVLPPRESLPDTCQAAVAARDAELQEAQSLLEEKDADITDWRKQAADERSLRLILEVDTTELRALVRSAKGVIHSAPVRPSLWERVRPGVYAGYGTTGGAPGPAVLVGWRLF